jgi:hypothetical protein
MVRQRWRTGRERRPWRLGQGGTARGASLVVVRLSRRAVGAESWHGCRVAMLRRPLWLMSVGLGAVDDVAVLLQH